MKRRNALRLMKRRALSRREVEAVLMDGPHDHDELRALVQAARRGAEPAELAGLAAATAAFRYAPVRDAARARARRTRLASRLAASAVGVKVAIACLGAAALGGIAYTAAGGTLPGTSQHSPSSSHSVASSTHSQVTSTPSRDSARPTPSASPHGSRPGTVAPASALRGLCVSWLASSNDPNRATNSRFSKLISAAGSAEAVTPYCTALVDSTGSGNVPHPSGIGNLSHQAASPSGGGNSTHPVHPTHPTNTPSKKPTPTH
jgi:hypothetical protein